MSVGFRLLGAVEANIDGQPVDLGSARQRCVLATLLVEANHVVPVEQLMDRVWGERPPLRVRGTLYSYLSRLRRVLAGSGEVRISQQSGGYLLAVDESAVDMHLFRRLVAEARRADDEPALALFEQALGLWRGEPFAGLDTPWLATVRATLEREWSAAALDHVDVALRCGRHSALLPALSALAGERPLDERVAGQLMLALYRSGRQAEALDLYRQIRRRTVDELGTDPGPPLQRLHQQILTADPELTVGSAGSVRSASTAAPASRPPVPRQLPLAPRLFVGRNSELDQLTAALHGHVDAGATVVISAIGGTGGIGKTWLAVHWAHRHVDRFPDGQLFVNLRGFDPNGQPTAPAVAIRGFLDALGADPAAIPVDLDAQVGLYRSLVADKRMLIVLDNARDTSQVAPLLPGGPHCTVLVTSRNALTGLVTTHGARPMVLDTLSPGESRELLTRHLGAQRIDAEPAAVDDLLHRCAGLPLALGIIAARAATHPELSLAVLAEELRQHAGRLDALDTGEADLNLRAVFSWSYQALRPEAANLFALLGLAPGPDIGLPAVASLAARPPVPVARLLRELETAHLVQQHVPGRYRLHDLVQLYAAEQAELLPDGSREQARLRLVDFYVHTAYAGERLLDSRGTVIQLGEPTAGCRPLPLHDDVAALAWFDAERANLVAIQRLAAERNLHPRVWQLAWAQFNFHFRRGYMEDHLAAWQAGLAAAQQSGDPVMQSMARRRLGQAYCAVGWHGEALRHLQQGLTLAEHTGDRANQAHTHFIISWVCEQHGDTRRALEHATRALLLGDCIDNPSWQAQMRNAVGQYQSRLGNHAQGRAHCETALAMSRSQGDRLGEAGALDNLGLIAQRVGDHLQAIHYHRQALDLSRELNDEYHEAIALDHLAGAHQASGQPEQARAAWQQALDLYETQRRTADAERVRQRLHALQPDGALIQ